MNIGRRHFLKFLSSAIAGTQVNDLSSTVSTATHFIDKKLGFGFKIPAGWHLETFRKDFRELLGGQQLSETFRGNPEIKDELGEGLIATLSKYPIEGDTQQRFSPSITFFRGSDSCLLDEFIDLRDLAEHSLSGFSTVLTDFECIENPEYIERNDCVMVRTKSKFLFEHEEIDSVFIDDETFVIHHENLIYTIHLYDSPYINDTSQNEFKLFKASLHIA